MSNTARSSWRTARFVVVDLEMTGLDPSSDEIISFAAVPIEGGRVLSRAAVAGLVRPERPPRPESIRIHGLRASDLEQAPRAPDALVPLVDALEGRIPIAHYAPIERTFLGPQLKALGRRRPRRMVDTAMLWRLLCVERGEGDPGACTLAQVVRGLRLPMHRAHQAEGDALSTAQAFLALATHLEGLGYRSVRALTGAEERLRAFGLWLPPAESRVSRD